jgi:hypothetical protein
VGTLSVEGAGAGLIVDIVHNLSECELSTGFRESSNDLLRNADFTGDGLLDSLPVSPAVVCQLLAGNAWL